LLSKIVGWNTDNDQATILVLFVKGLKAGILRSVAALARDVYQKEDLTPVAFQTHRLAVNGLQGIAINAGGRHGHADRSDAKGKNENQLPHKILHISYTSHRSTACKSEVFGSPVGTNSCATYPLYPVSTMPRMTPSHCTSCVLFNSWRPGTPPVWKWPSH